MGPQQPNQGMIVLKQIWPTIQKVINGTFYFLINLIKSIVRASIDQIKGSF